MADKAKKEGVQDCLSSIADSLEKAVDILERIEKNTAPVDTKKEATKTIR
jgi:hypothetical protein